MTLQSGFATLRLDRDFETTEEHPVRRKIKSFAELPVGWHYGEGRPVDAGAIVRALRIHDIGLSLQLKTDAFPGINGELAVTFYSKECDECVQVVVDSSTLYDVRREVGSGFSFDVRDAEEGVDIGHVYRMLESLAEESPAEDNLWNSSGLFIHGALTST